MPPPPDFPRVLAEQLRADGSRPLVTFYDDATGERVELSVVTYANWVAKTASLVSDELMVERGGLALVDLPTHWLAPVWLGALWSVGLTVTADPSRAAEVDLVVCGPEGLARYAEPAGAATAPASDVPVVALSLLPMAGRFTEPLPPGVTDFSQVVWGQPDLFVPVDLPLPGDRAWAGSDGTLTQQEVLAEAAGTSGRLLTEVAPTSRAGLSAFLGPLQSGDGTVWVRHAAPDRRAERAAAERAVLWPGHPPRS
ncbi:TIGR03089 family protein [Nocardioides sp. HDW12B]|uniref:TIGR03089 family protein n=1 Tax=Nocardioides sp. HDW12B TaxID=2714939 RepID=UPI00140A7037|nr:TIGR03089 family protein [Nocardioides sp. HDW12B]QIK65575.1 TIGR03089 family protein [Nocardioides sp. HDW12B]